MALRSFKKNTDIIPMKSEVGLGICILKGFPSGSDASEGGDPWAWVSVTSVTENQPGATLSTSTTDPYILLTLSLFFLFAFTFAHLLKYEKFGLDA